MKHRISILLVILLVAAGLSSCSSTRKAHKKCRECPEFSINNNDPSDNLLIYEVG